MPAIVDRKLIRALAFAVVLQLCAACAHSPSQWRPKFTVHRDTFKNGLTVLFVEDHSAPVVSYTTWFKVGSAWERPGATGIAHLFEHMMFKGTPRYSGKQFFHNLESKGALVNAFTQHDATVYYEVIPSKYLEHVIDMEADRLAHLSLTQADLDAERQVVKEERRLRVESNFGAQQLEALLKLAFPTHPYGWPPIGYQVDLDRLTLDQCKAFFNDFYQPGNAIVTIAGDFDYEQAKVWIEKYYGSIEGHAIRELTLADERLPNVEKRLEITRPVEAPSVLIGYYIPSMYSEDADKLAMLAWSLFGMSSSRANVRLVREKRVALSVGAEAGLERYPYLFMISAELKRGASTKQTEEELYRLIEEAKEEPVSEAEIERVKNGLVYSTINEGKSPTGVASWLASGEYYYGDYNHIFGKLDRYQKMRPSDLQEVARKYLSANNRVVVVMRPEKASAKK